MKKLFALPWAFLSLAMFVPLAGCGGSDSSASASALPGTVAVPGASVVANGSGRAVRVSWKPSAKPNPDASDIVEYRIYRAAVPDDYVSPPEPGVSAGASTTPSTNTNIPVSQLPNMVLVGVVDADTTTFVDTPQEHTFVFQDFVLSDTHEPNTLFAFRRKAPALLPSSYVYDIRFVYRRANFKSSEVELKTGELKPLYTEGRFYEPMQPVRYD